MADKPTKIQELAERKRKEYEQRKQEEEAQKSAKRQKQLAAVHLDEEDDEAGGLPHTQRQREAAQRAGTEQERMPVVDESDPEDLVENDLDRDFIDDEGAEPPDEGGYASDGEQQRIAQAEEAEEAEQDELDAMFKPKKKGRQERNHGERRQIVESFLARMEVAAEADIRSHEAGFPAVEKLKLLTDMEQELAQRDLHEDFLDAGILGVLKAWLEPMGDGTLPNLRIRSAVLRALINLNFLYEERRDALKNSGIGKMVMFLYKLPDETPANRKMAKQIVERWSRPIFESHRDPRDEEREAQRFEELRSDERRRQEAATAAEHATAEERKALNPRDKGFRFHAAVPQGARLDYQKQPQSRVAADNQAFASGRQKPRKGGLLKKIDDVAKRSKLSGRAAKVSVEGRGM